jgi:TolB protein
MVFYLLLICCGYLGAESVTLETINARAHTKMPVLVGLLDRHHTNRKVAHRLKEDLEWTGQFQVTDKHLDTLQTKSDITKWASQYPLAIFLSHTDEGISWRMYDTATAQMIKGTCTAPRTNMRAFAHAIADEVWPALTGNKGFFSSKIVYSKQQVRRGRDCRRYLYMRDATDEDGETEQLLVDTPTVSMAPRWNRETQNPMVLYSEYTKTNVRLIAVDMRKRRSIVSNFDGVNMQVSYAPDGKQVVYCLSRAPKAGMKPHRTSQLYYYSADDAQKPVFKRLTLNDGNNFAPCWGPGNSIFYASDVGRLGMPNIYWMDLQTGVAQPITTKSFAVSPSYSAVTGRLAYTKMVGGKTQVCTYDLQANVERQLTFDATNKDDVSWSPCGTMLSYTVEAQGASRIAMLNTATNEQRFLTAQGQDCCYPCWSPLYQELPMIG